VSGRFCLQCGIELVRRKLEKLGVWKERRFCSRECNINYQRIKRKTLRSFFPVSYSEEDEL
jgi:hypothetical protein